MTTGSQPTIYPKRVIGPEVAQEIAGPLNKGVIVLLGRNSSAGPVAREYAAIDLHMAADELAKQGIDIRSELPSKTKLQRDLQEAEVHVVTRFGPSGLPVKLQWVIYDLRATCGVVAVVCAGTGKQASDDCTQPWIKLVDGVVAEHDAALVFAKVIHRLARVTWLAGPLLGRLQLTGALLGCESGIAQVTDATSVPLFIELNQSSVQASALPASSKRAMRARTESEMIDGRAIIAFYHGLPAGLARVRLRARSGRPPSLLYLDDPRFRPDPSEVASGLSEAVDVDGSPANQVAALQHLFATAFTPGWRPVDGVRELRRRGFSTDKVRGFRDLDATMRDTSDSNAMSSLRTIWKRLEFYETGVLTCPVGAEGEEPIVVVGCMPPEGWAKPEDFARIREGLTRQPARRRNFNFMLTGLPIIVDGKACQLRSRPRTYTKKAVDKRPIYNAHAVEPGVVSPRVSIPHVEFVQMYVNGISAAFDTAVTMFDADRASSSPELDVLWSKRDAAARSQSELEEQCRVVLDRVAVATGPLSVALETRYNDELHPALASATAVVADLDRKIGVERGRLAHVARPLAAERLLHLIAALGDATSGEFRDLLLGSTRDVRLVRRSWKRRGTTRIDFELTGVLRVGAGDRVADIPLEHSWSTGAMMKADERATDLLELVRSGVPLHVSRVTGKGAAVVALAERLGTPVEDLLLCRIRDGRIARAVLEVVYLRRDRSDAELAEALDEPDGFIARIAEVYANPRARWLLQNASYLTALYASAAHNDGVALLDDVARWAGDKRARLSVVVRDHGHGLEMIRGVGYRVPPCEFCGCIRLYPLRIDEPVGPVCSACRKDRRGLVWPADPYDAYVSEPGLWMFADAQDGSALSPSRSSRSMW